MNYSRISIGIEGSTGLITLGVDGGIFLTAELCTELETALEASAADDAIRVLVITGANAGVFMRHYSVSEILALSEQLKQAGLKPGDAMPYQKAPIDRCIDRIETMAKPVVAAINGECMGGAMELALGCDLRLAQTGPYRLGQPETLLGILPGAGGTQRLVRTVGYANAMRLALTGLPITPDEALRVGLVHEVCPDALKAARAAAAHLARLPAAALAHTKRLIRESEKLPLEEGLRLERTLFMDLCLREEGRQLMRAYEDGEYTFSLENRRWSVSLPERKG
jgi:enoyl-CoA hydratase